MEHSSALIASPKGDGAAADPTPDTPAGNGMAHAWAALGGDPALIDRVLVERRAGLLPARLPVLELARSTVAVCSLAAAELAGERMPQHARVAVGGGTGVAPVRVHDGAVATAFTSERHLLIDGRAPIVFAPLSRFWRTADGWLRTHANYPHHRSRLLAALSLTDTGDDEALAGAVAAELAQRSAEEVEEVVYAAGGLAVAVRSPHTWRRHPQGAAVAGRPLLAIERLDAAPPLPFASRMAHRAAARWQDPQDGTRPRGPLPLDGVRVLDLTRVIAGPVATRTLALLGADVLRVDPPQLAESGDAHADTGFGKRSALLDLSSRAGQADFEELLASAHVVLTGYRPGALDRFGLAPESLADRRPGLVVGQLSAWGGYGPWHRRRGFDSLVQAASGVAVVEARQDDGSPGGPPGGAAAGADRTPGALPAQALDHGTGYLLAAAVLRSFTEQRRGTGGSRVVRLALARTASWLLDGLTRQAAPPLRSGPTRVPAFEPGPWLTETEGPLGRLRHARSPIGYEHGPADWPHPPGPAGGDAPAWQ